jgi:hypothetical protein
MRHGNIANIARDCHANFTGHVGVMSSVFFSEEKNQKTFTFSATPKVPAMAGKPTLAQKQKSFASFLQKRRVLVLVARIAPGRCGPAIALSISG